MLAFLRRTLSSWLVLGLLGLLMIIFLVTGVQTPTGGSAGASGGDTLVTVGGEAVTSSEVRTQLDRQLNQLRKEQPELDIAALVRGGAFEEAVKQLTTARAIMAWGKDHGFAVSKQMIDAEIVKIPAFQNLAGRFDETAFRAALAQQRLSEQQLRQEIAANLMERQVVLPVVGTATIPQGMAVQYASLLLETRKGMVGVVPTKAMPSGPEPGDQELAAFYTAQKARYTIPERRVVRYAAFGREQVAAAAKPTDSEIEQAYKANAGRYSATETRTLSQVVLQDEAKARAFAAKVAGGTSFALAATAAGFSAGDIALGQHSKADYAKLASAQAADTAFSLPKGGTSQPIRTPFGWTIVHVDSINVTPGKSLAAARPELEKALSEQKAQNALQDLANRIQDDLGRGKSFADVVKGYNLSAQETPPVTSTGQAPGVQNWQPAPDLQPLLKGAFQMRPDDPPAVDTVKQNERYAVVSVARTLAAAPPPLAQIRDQVRSDLVARRAAEKARQVAAAILAKVNSGMPMQQAFAQAGVALPGLQPLTARRLDIAKQGQQVAAPLKLLFRLAKGKAGMTAAPQGGGWFIVAVQDLIPGNASTMPGLAEATRQEFSRVVGNEYGEQFVRSIQTQVKVKRDEKAIADLKRQLLGVQ
jgi:peptidyl-prolyl cis-trans isomerase D